LAAILATPVWIYLTPQILASFQNEHKQVVATSDHLLHFIIVFKNNYDY